MKQYLHQGLLVAAMVNALLSPSWQAVALVLLAAGTYALMSLRDEEQQSLKLQLSEVRGQVTKLASESKKIPLLVDGFETLQKLTKAQEGALTTLEKKQAELNKLASMTSVAQSFRPRIKDGA